MPIVKVADQDFEKVVLQSEKPVLLEFSAPWCGPCKVLAPILEQISEERDDIIIAKLNIDKNPETADRYSVMAIPNLIIFKSGLVADKKQGTLTRTQLEDWINSMVATQ